MKLNKQNYLRVPIFDDVMNKERYQVKTDDSHVNFEFDSHGPNGAIKKVIEYYEIGRMSDGITVLNVGFGDWDDT